MQELHVRGKEVTLELGLTFHEADEQKWSQQLENVDQQMKTAGEVCMGQCVVDSPQEGFYLLLLHLHKTWVWATQVHQSG